MMLHLWWALLFYYMLCLPSLFWVVIFIKQLCQSSPISECLANIRTHEKILWYRFSHLCKRFTFWCCSIALITGSSMSLLCRNKTIKQKSGLAFCFVKVDVLGPLQTVIAIQYTSLPQHRNVDKLVFEDFPRFLTFI